MRQTLRRLYICISYTAPCISRPQRRATAFPAPRQSVSDKSNEGLPPLFSFLKRKPMLAALNSLDGVPAAAEASGRAPSKVHRPEAAQTACSAGRRWLVMVPSAITHQHAAEAANGGSWLKPGGGSHQMAEARLVLVSDLARVPQLERRRI